MNTLSTMRLAVACAAACFAGFAWADSTQPDSSSGSPQASQDVGGMPSSTGAAGASMRITRAQVYQDLVRAEQNGQLADLQKGLYRGQ